MRANLTKRVALSSLLWLAACGGDDDKGAVEEEAETDAFALQAARGATLYGRHCASCHGDSGQGSEEAPRLVGLDQGALPEKPPASRAVRTVDFVTVADVASFAVANMPPGEGGSLSNAEYLAILAFDLKANGITLEEELSLELAAELTIPR
jgi:mono/diheme cytochrome c family protein